MFRRIALVVLVAAIFVAMLGWLFGVVSMGLYTFRLVRQRKKLERSLTVSEQEVSSLRNLPLADAD